MGSQVSVHPKELIHQHLLVLRAYAWRVLCRGEALTAKEEDDRAERAREFLAIGRSFKLTGKEMVSLLYRGLLRQKRGCGCPGCLARR